MPLCPESEPGSPWGQKSRGDLREVNCRSAKLRILVPVAEYTGAGEMGRKEILARYERDESGLSIIDVSIAAIGDLYSNFDRTAHYLRKDLDTEFVDYLIGCAEELAPHPFLVRIGLLRVPDAAQCERVRQSLQTYFAYRRDAELRDLRALFRRAAGLFVLGLTLITVSVFVHDVEVRNPGILTAVVAEGLTVAAWVSLWNTIAMLLLDWQPHRHMIRLFRRLQTAPVIFLSPQNVALPEGQLERAG